MDWWLQSRATRNLEGVVTGNTPLMGTPTSRDYKGVPGDNVQMASLPRDVSLLPTPRCETAVGQPEVNWQKTRPSGAKSSLDLATAVVVLLPTPNATDRKGSNVPQGRERWNRTHPIERHDGDLNLPGAVALLPTPNADESHHASRGASVRRAAKRQSEGRQLSVEEAVVLLPTPNSFDAHLARDAPPDISGEAIELQLRRGNPEGSRRNTTGSLAKEVKLLPTPQAFDGMMEPKTREQIQVHRDEGRGGDRNLREAVLYELPSPAGETPAHVESRWGRYEPAIRRWEAVLGREAPEPTEAGKDGKPRLSPAFTEFLMGLPEGWVCGTGISRKGQLHALGNGVVSLQAELALRILLERQIAASLQEGENNG